MNFYTAEVRHCPFLPCPLTNGMLLPRLQRKLLLALSMARPSPPKLMRLMATSSAVPPTTWQQAAVSRACCMHSPKASRSECLGCLLVGRMSGTAQHCRLAGWHPGRLQC